MDEQTTTGSDRAYLGQVQQHWQWRDYVSEELGPRTLTRAYSASAALHPPGCLPEHLYSLCFKNVLQPHL